MKITLTLDTENSSDIDSAMDLLASITGGTTGTSSDAGGDTEADDTAAKKKATAEKRKAAAAKKKAAEEKAAEEAAAEAGPTRVEVRTALKEYAALEGKEAAIQILKDNGAASIGELDEDSFGAVIDACGD